MEVGVGGGEAAGVGKGLVEGGMDATIGGVDVLGEFFDVGIFEFDAGAPVKDEVNNGVVVAKLEELVFVCFILASGGALGVWIKGEGFKEELAELFGGGKVDACTGVLAECDFEFEEVGFELVSEALEAFGVNAYAGGFHVKEDGGEGFFTGGEEVKEVAVFEFGLEGVVEAIGDVGIFCGVVEDLLGGELIHGKGRFSFSEEVLKGDGLVVEEEPCGVIEGVVVGGVVEVGGEKGVVEGTLERDAEALENGAVKTEVVTNFSNRGGVEEGEEGLKGSLLLFNGFGEREIPGLAVGDSKGTANGTVGARVEASGFGIEGNEGFVEEALSKLEALFLGGNEGIGVGMGLESGEGWRCRCRCIRGCRRRCFGGGG